MDAIESVVAQAQKVHEENRRLAAIETIVMNPLSQKMRDIELIFGKKIQMQLRRKKRKEAWAKYKRLR